METGGKGGAEGGTRFPKCFGQGTQVRTMCSVNALGKRPPRAKDRLLPGESLRAGQELYSPTGGYRLVFHGTGRLSVVDHFDVEVWNNLRNNSALARLQGGGATEVKLEVGTSVKVKNGTETVWEVGNAPEGGYLRSGDSGELFFFAKGGKKKWGSGRPDRSEI